MKFTPLTYLVAGAVAVSSVAAAPVRIVVVTGGMTTPFEPSKITAIPPSLPYENMNMHMNAMHAASQADGAHPHFRHRPGCAMKTKAVEMMNKFRAAVGWPLIDTKSHDHHRGAHHHHHMMHNDASSPTNINDVQAPGKFCAWAYVNPEHQVTCFRTKEKMEAAILYHKMHDTSFAQRVMDALLSLGRWEGRAVAFVLGCGLGVLIRMIWVLFVVAFRAVKAPCSSSAPHDEGYEAVYAEELFVAPPEYTYQDEKSGEVMVVKAHGDKDAQEIA